MVLGTKNGMSNKKKASAKRGINSLVEIVGFEIWGQTATD